LTLEITSEYNTLSEEAGHPLTRSEMGNHHPFFYDKIKAAENDFGLFDFIPHKRAQKISKRVIDDNQKPIYPGYKEAEIKYNNICNQKGHVLSRTQLSHSDRALYTQIKIWEKEGKAVPFIPGKPLDTLHLENAGRAKNLVANIDDTPRNKTKAYRKFNEDKNIPFKYSGMDYPI
jgi:hypothetical protein